MSHLIPANPPDPSATRQSGLKKRRTQAFIGASEDKKERFPINPSNFSPRDPRRNALPLNAQSRTNGPGSSLRSPPHRSRRSYKRPKVRVRGWFTLRFRFVCGQKQRHRTKGSDAHPIPVARQLRGVPLSAHTYARTHARTQRAPAVTSSFQNKSRFLSAQLDSGSY